MRTAGGSTSTSATRTFASASNTTGNGTTPGARARGHDTARRRWLAKEMRWEVIPVTKDFLAYPAPYLEALLTALLHRGWNPDSATVDRIATRLRNLNRRPR